MLKEVVFCDRSFTSEIFAFLNDGRNIFLENVVHPGDLVSIFRGWPKVGFTRHFIVHIDDSIITINFIFFFKLSKIGLYNLPPSYVTPILQAFGPELQHIEFKKCGDEETVIRLVDLALCRQLEGLRFLESDISFVPQEMDSTFDADTFLPQLKSFESTHCLGRHSRLFEEKSTLARLVIKCSHVKIELDRHDEPLPKRLKQSSQVSYSLFHIWIHKIGACNTNFVHRPPTRRDSIEFGNYGRTWKFLLFGSLLNFRCLSCPSSSLTSST